MIPSPPTASAPKVRSSPKSSATPHAEIDAWMAHLLVKQDLDRAYIDQTILRIDRYVSDQINAILHAKPVQALECAWRTLDEMVSRMDFRENTQLCILNTTKDELLEDFEDAGVTTASTLYQRVYTDEFGTHGGRPYALICANFHLGPNPDDLFLLRECACVAAMAHAPFIANADPTFFGETSISELPQLADLDALLKTPGYDQWHALRTHPDTRNVGLCLPRFLLRLPYGETGTPVQSFHFEENCEGHHTRFLWGPASALFACQVAQSFAKYRWCPNITGTASGGTVEGLLHHRYETMGSLQTRIPTEIQVTDAREYTLRKAGFISLCYQKRTANACFFSANSIYAPKAPAKSQQQRDIAFNQHVEQQLPYLFIVTRLAHYVKVLQREHVGAWLSTQVIENDLNDWIRSYVADMDTPSPAVRARRPLRRAKIRVIEQAHTPGWLRCQITVRPHFKYLGADLNLSLLGKLDKT